MEALGILRMRYVRWEREEREKQRERERERERERDRDRDRDRETETERDGSDVTVVALKLATSIRFPLPKILTFFLPRIFVSAFSNAHHCGAEIPNEFALFVVNKIRTFFSFPG